MSDLAYWLATLYLPNIGSQRVLTWLTFFKEIKNLFCAEDAVLREASIPEKYWNALRNPDWLQVEKDLAWLHSSPHHSIIAYNNAAYPALLKEINDPPLILFVKGEVNLLQQPQIAMVGTRHPTAYGLHNAEQFSEHLAREGWVITSGLALGIDGACHKGALKAKGKTLGVAGTGLYHTYPKAHEYLAQEILEEGGALISEFPLKLTAYPANFPRRNRLIAGLALGVIVVEAALKSGSLITARLSLENGREVFAIPGSIHHPLTRGCHHLIREGAKLVETAADIIEELGPLKAFNQAHQALPPTPTEELPLEFNQVLDYIGVEITPLDVILLRSGLTISVVSSILLTLELNGYIQSIAGGYSRIVANH